MSRFSISVFVVFLMTVVPLRAAQDVEVATRSTVDTAIASVYPSLVRIHVVSTRFKAGREIKTESSGSGAIISPDGYVVTNHHVAGKAKRLRCTLSDKREVEATLIGTDPLTDIAVIRLEEGSFARGEFPVAPFGDSDAVRVGDRVLAMGSPLALSQSVTLGIVSNVEMTMPKLFWPATFKLDGEETGSLVKWIGHDARIFPGNSGGPLVNEAGEIIGINEISLGLAGAIPGNLAREVARQLIEHGHLRRSWLGFTLQPLLSSEDDEGGVRVSSVVPDSPAHEAGLRAGDILVEYDGHPLNIRYGEQFPELNHMMLSTPVGDEVSLAYRRAGQLSRTSAVTVERGSAQGKESQVARLGVSVRDLTLLAAKALNREPETGVLVSTVRPGAAAAEAKPRLERGDIIVEVAGSEVRNVADLRVAIDEAPEGELTLVGFERRSERLLTAAQLGGKQSKDRSAEATKAWVPVATQVLTPTLGKALGIDARGGVRVTEVYADGAAPAAGLLVGDVLLGIDEQPIPAQQPEDVEVFASIVRQYRVGSTVKLEGVRDSKPLSIEVELAESPPSVRELAEYRDERFDFAARDLTLRDRLDPRLDEAQPGALITGVESGGWAALARLAVGDIVLAVDDQPIASGADLEAQMARVQEARARRVVFLVRRGVSTLFLELEPDWEQH